jgi:hypothetical protein
MIRPAGQRPQHFLEERTRVPACPGRACSSQTPGRTRRRAPRRGPRPDRFRALRTRLHFPVRRSHNCQPKAVTRLAAQLAEAAADVAAPCRHPPPSPDEPPRQRRAGGALEFAMMPPRSRPTASQYPPNSRLESTRAGRDDPGSAGPQVLRVPGRAITQTPVAEGAFEDAAPGPGVVAGRFRAGGDIGLPRGSIALDGQ